MGEDRWPESVVRSNGVLMFGARGVSGRTPRDEQDTDWTLFGPIVHDGPRAVICADCGVPIVDGYVVHVKPETYAVEYLGETFYLERHIGVSCGCAARRGLLP